MRLHINIEIHPAYVLLTGLLFLMALPFAHYGLKRYFMGDDLLFCLETNICNNAKGNISKLRAAYLKGYREAKQAYQKQTNRETANNKTIKLDPEFIKQLEKQYGYDKPWYVRFAAMILDYYQLTHQDDE